MSPDLTLPHAELLTPAQMAVADAAAPRHGTALSVLMARAGWAVARAIRARFAPCRTLVLCGPGNNGGDGYVAARLLAAAGWPVEVAALAPPANALAAQAAAGWHGPVGSFAPDRAAGAALVIDAVFGAGLTRDVTGLAAATLAAARRLVAVDVPSGVDGATGAVRGTAAQAVLTVTFARAKPGHLLLPGRDLCGELVLADIGLPAAALAAAAAISFANGPSLWTLPAVGATGHKYSRGHVTVLGGAAMPGAARLAADAARHAGAGLVTIAAIAGGADIYRAGVPGLIVSDASLDDLLADERRRVWVCGPGLGAATVAKALPRLLAAGRQVVADADTFAAFAGRPDALRGAAVLTPHAGEFDRVFGPPGDDRLAAARAAARATGAVVLLKGSDTIIAAPDGRAAINHDAPPWLATAGSGDVLAGVIGGLLAQGLPPWPAACAGAWLHGRAGRHAGAGLVAEDLPPLLRRAAADAARPPPPATLLPPKWNPPHE